MIMLNTVCKYQLTANKFSAYSASYFSYLIPIEFSLLMTEKYFRMQRSKIKTRTLIEYELLSYS